MGICMLHQDKVEEAVEQIIHWANRFDVMVIGPGLGRDALVHDTVKEASQSQQLSLIIDGSWQFT